MSEMVIACKQSVLLPGTCWKHQSGRLQHLAAGGALHWHARKVKVTFVMLADLKLTLVVWCKSSWYANHV